MGTLAINLRPAEASGVGGLPRKSPHTDLLPLEYLVAAEPAPTYTPVAPPDAAITGRIHIIRGQKIMLDRDLAELYGVETKHLKRQVRRNLGRFPEDFMPACRTGRFELTAVEWATLRYQFGTSKDEMLSERGGSRVLPMAFTEQGVAMLSSVLNSEQAILVNIHIIRVFSRTCLPAGRCAKCSFRTARSSRNWNNWRVASQATTKRSRPFSITSRNWSPQRSKRVSLSASNRKLHHLLLVRQLPTPATVHPHKTVLQPS